MRIGNLVFDIPDAESAARVADLYAELLGMRRLSRGDSYREAGWPADEGDDLDPLVMDDDPTRPNIAFEWAGEGYRAPRWPDPDHPQQLHADLEVPDLDTAHRVVLAHGGALLLEDDAHRVYADAVGHPLCLLRGPQPRIARIVFDGCSPRTLAAFWSGLLGWTERTVDTPLRVELAPADGRGPALAFQHSLGAPPRWPDPAHPQQLHLDPVAPEDADADALHELAERLGAVRLPYLGGGFVFADPAGHPFCLGE
jgi:hypothetical protein